MFLPDPRDGSLYLFGRESEALKKLPFTIPQLVASSPCRSSDGILYTGRKIDTWFSIDPTTGEKEQLLSFHKVKDTCPLEMQNSIFVGRTEYNIIIVDSKRKDRKWNVTFYDYSAMQMKADVTDNYGIYYLSSLDATTHFGERSIIIHEILNSYRSIHALRFAYTYICEIRIIRYTQYIVSRVV